MKRESIGLDDSFDLGSGRWRWLFGIYREGNWGIDKEINNDNYETQLV